MMRRIANLGKYTSGLKMNFSNHIKPIPAQISGLPPISPKFTPLMNPFFPQFPSSKCITSSIFKLPSTPLMHNFSTSSSFSVSMTIRGDPNSGISIVQYYTDGIDKLRTLFGRSEENRIKCTGSRTCTNSTKSSLSWKSRKSRKSTDAESEPTFAVLTLETREDDGEVLKVQLKINLDDIYVTGCKLVDDKEWRPKVPQYGSLTRVRIGPTAIHQAVRGLYHELRKKRVNEYAFENFADTICIHIAEAVRFFAIEKFIVGLMAIGHDDCLNDQQIVLIRNWVYLGKLRRKVLDGTMTEAKFNKDKKVKDMGIKYEDLGCIIAILKAK